MNADTEPGRGPARLFADFLLLPDLLAVGDDDVLAAWTNAVRDAGCNLGHVEDEDVPPGLPIERALAEDALWLALQLRLIEKSPQRDAFQCAEAGRRIADVALTPMDDRGQDQNETVRMALAEQVRACWLGADKSPVSDLLRDGAFALAETAHGLPGCCPGLLLIEFESLVHEASASKERMQYLLRELPGHRDLAMRRHDMPSPDVDPIQNMGAYPE